MKIKVRYQTKEEIPEGLEPYYAEQDGEFVLQAEGMKTQGDVDRAMAAMDKQKQLRIEAEKELARYREVDLDKWEKLKDLDPDGGPGGSSDGDVQRQISDAVRKKEREMQERFREREEALKAEKRELEEKFKSTYLEHWRRSMLAEKFGFTDPNDLDTFLLKIKYSELSDFSEINRMMRQIEVIEEGGRLKVVGGELKDEKGAVEILERVAKSEVAKNFRPAPNTSGGGAANSRGSDGSVENPYKKETWNLTEQARLERESPDDAKRLAKAAGIDL